MIGAAIYAHWHSLILHRDPWDVIRLHLVPSIWINAGMLYHLFKAATVAPSRPTPGSAAGLAATGRWLGWCAPCGGFKPAATHHCRVCRQCAEELDHHCPFTANCVGKKNFPYFFGFVLWAWIATVYAVWLTGLPGRVCFGPQSHKVSQMQPKLATYPAHTCSDAAGHRGPPVRLPLGYTRVPCPRGGWIPAPLNIGASVLSFERALERAAPVFIAPWLDRLGGQGRDS